MANCRQCGSPKTIRAHIVPKALSLDAKGDEKHLITTSPDRYGNSQSGYWDDGILCESCDGKLGLDDKYAVEMCREQKTVSVTADKIIELDFDGHRLARFANAVLWRASISSHPLLNRINLGPFEDVVRRGLFSEPDGAVLRTTLFPFSDGALIKNLLSYPTRHRSPDGLTSYSMVMGGFRWTVYVDKREMKGGMRRLIINSQNPIQTGAIPLRESSEFPAITGLIRRLDKKDLRS